MDVAVSDLRSNLREWLDRVRTGDEVVVTDRGTPVARLVAVDSTSVIDELTRRGVLAPPQVTQRPVATGRRRPRPRRGSVADYVSQQRD